MLLELRAWRVVAAPPTRTVALPQPGQALRLGDGAHLLGCSGKREALLGHLENDLHPVQRGLHRLGGRPSHRAGDQVVDHTPPGGPAPAAGWSRASLGHRCTTGPLPPAARAAPARRSRLPGPPCVVAPRLGARPRAWRLFAPSQEQDQALAGATSPIPRRHRRQVQGVIKRVCIRDGRRVVPPKPHGERRAVRGGGVQLPAMTWQSRRSSCCACVEEVQ